MWGMRAGSSTPDPGDTIGRGRGAGAASARGGFDRGALEEPLGLAPPGCSSTAEVGQQAKAGVEASPGVEAGG